MTNEERRDQLRDLTRRLIAAREELEAIFPELTLDVDRQAARSIMTDLLWAAENCSVIGRHQVGEALEDTMGYRRRDTET
ncbi:MAG TPA: hypothetical protein VGN57_18555 [Pirellulaceae bacterium]|jgi:hypothetical protein|nr:hypothetical protein [Pirellulaceae bacterium]